MGKSERVKDRYPFTQRLVQQATNVWLQDKKLAVLNESKVQCLNFVIQVKNFSFCNRQLDQICNHQIHNKDLK